MATFVVVHGAWGGGWSWNRFVVPLLRKAGHDVFPVTLTGLGERTHLAHPDIDLETHIQDVLNVLFYEDLQDVVLVGHSYGGNVITGVADRCPERLRQLVYLDAATPSDGQASADMSAGRREELEQRARQGGDGWTIPPGPTPPDQPAAISEWAAQAHRPADQDAHSAPTADPRQTALPRAYVYCTVGKEPGSPQARRAERIKSDPRWTYRELHTGHTLQYSAPEETVRLLTELAES